MLKALPAAADIGAVSGSRLGSRSRFFIAHRHPAERPHVAGWRVGLRA